MSCYRILPLITGKEDYTGIIRRSCEKAEELSGLFENIGNPADAAEQNADLETEMADRMHAV